MPPQPPSPQELAFVRAWAEGLDVLIAWHRYLGADGGDARRARGALTRLLERLRGIAVAHQRPDLSKLLVRDPEGIVDGADDAGTAARCRQRLRTRLVQAIDTLVTMDAGARRAPRLADPLGLWLEPAVVGRLASVGVQRIEHLVFWIRMKGFHWHRGIQRIGPSTARRIVGWLKEHEESLGSLAPSSLVPPAQFNVAAVVPAARTGIVPLERFSPPSDRDGSQGTNRATTLRCKIAASNDYEAIQAWLRLRQSGSHTWRAYRKEAERFLLWAVISRRKALSSLDGDDCVAYRDFLAAPGLEWTGPRHAQRWSEAWRPFEGPLSVRSQGTARTIVRSLCEWLVRRHYLDSNPWDDVPVRGDPPSMPQLRAFSQRQWGLIQAWIRDEVREAPTLANERLLFLLDFGYMTGMRLAELAAAELGWLRHEQLDDGEWVWSIMVLGKRNKWREVPLPEAATEALRRWLHARGLSADVLANPPATALVARVDRDEAISASRLYEILQRGFERCAVAVYTRDKRSAERIREGSTHWLRHTYGSHASARGVAQDVLQMNLGHESPVTTSIYVRAEQSRRHREVAKAFALSK